MIVIPVVVKQMPDGLGDGGMVSVNTPQEKIPLEAIAIICDGTNYTVYMPGDTMPALTTAEGQSPQ